MALLIGRDAWSFVRSAGFRRLGRTMVEMLPTAVLLVLAVSVVAKDNITCE